MGEVVVVFGRFNNFTSVSAFFLLSLSAVGTKLLYSALTIPHTVLRTLCPFDHLVSMSAKSLSPPSMCSIEISNRDKCIAQRCTFSSTYLGALKRGTGGPNTYNKFQWPVWAFTGFRPRVRSPSCRRLAQVRILPFHTFSNSPAFWRTVLQQSQSMAHASVCNFLCLVYALLTGW